MTHLGLFSVLAAWASFQTPATQTGPLTIEQATAIAEQKAFAVRLQVTSLEKDREKINEALGGLGPKVTLAGNYNRNDRQNSVSFGPSSPPVIIQPIDTKTVTASVTIPIDISGNAHRLVKASEATYRATKYTTAATLNDTRLNTRSAFFAVLRAQAQVVVYEQALKDAQERLDQGQKLLKQVQVAKIDVERYEAQVAQANSDLINAKNSLELSKIAFNNALARPVDTPVDLVDIKDLPAVPTDAGLLSRSAIQYRPEVNSIKDSVEALDLIRRAQESGLSPSLALTVQHQRSFGQGGLGAQTQQTTGALSLSFPIFDSGVTRSRVNQARQDVLRAKIQLEQTQLAISQEVQNAFANLSSAQSRFNNAKRQAELAEEVFRLAKVRQNAGEGTYVEVIDAETSVTQARNGVVSARYDYLVAFSQLQRAIGTDNLAKPEMAANGGSK